MKKWVLAACVLAGATTAQAGKIEPGASHNPPRVADESDVSFRLMHQGKADGYGFKAEGKILNHAEGDRLRLDAMQGTKVVASAKCRVNGIDQADYSKFECQSDKRDLKMKGNVTFDLVYEDDKTDKEYLARRFNVNVQLWGGETWEITPDDLLGPGYIDSNVRADQTERRLYFRFWVSNGAIDTLGNGPFVFRCKVDGKSIPDFEIESGTAVDADSIDVDIIKGPKRTTWKWNLFQFSPRALYVGTRTGELKDPKKELRLTADYPGTWECALRQQGRALRELAFVLDEKGLPKAHPLDSAKGTVPLRKGVAMLDMKIPKGAAIDQRIKPDQLKKSRGFGLAWPDDPAVKAIHAALPPAYEDQAPKYVKPKGKRLGGLEHDPPRFVDNSTTEVQVWRSTEGDFKGYKAKLFATVSGFTAAADRFRMDWRQGKKVLGTGKCDWSKNFVTDVRCEAPGPFKAKGALEADLIYEDDDDGNEYLVRTYAVNVYNPKTFGDAVWLITPDDTLATGWVNIGHREDAELQLHLWFTNEKLGNEMKLRCTANGKQLADIKMSDSQTPAALVHEADVRAKQNGPVIEYFWYHLYSPTTILTGPKDKSRTLQQKDKVMWLADNPGQWDCMVRADGKPVRQLLFTVSKDGYVEADPAQVDSKFPFLGKHVPIDVRIPKESKLDTRIKADAMKKSRGFGLPWPKTPTKPFPATGGLPDPK